MRDFQPETLVPEPEDRLTPQEAADYLGVSVETLRGWRSRRTGPVFYQIAKSILFYAKSDCRAWLAQRRVRPRN